MDSRRIDSDSTVDMVFHLKWKCDGVAHTDGYQASRINIWRDYIPPTLLEEISGKQAGERFELQLTSNEFIQEYAKQGLFQIKNKQFDPQSTLGAKVNPAVGRFYPRGILKSVAGVFSANVQPKQLESGRNFTNSNAWGWYSNTLSAQVDLGTSRPIRLGDCHARMMINIFLICGTLTPCM